jgi:hypothetical protein
MPQLFARLGVAGGLLIVAGGLAYSAGAAVYACAAPTRHRPCSATTRSSTCWSSPGSPPTSWPSACTHCPAAERTGLRILWLSQQCCLISVYLELDCTCLAKIRPTVHRGERGRRGQQHRGWGRRSGAGRQVGHLAASTALPVGIAAALVLFELHLLYQQQRATDRVLQPPAGSGSS